MSNDRLLGKWKEKSESTLIEIWSSSDMKKNALDMKVVEDEDCFILDFDPFESIDLSKKLNISMDDDNDASDLSVIAERGQVACRDYPHSRHLCVKFPFNRTSHESYCEQCYCYVCDSIAPCKYWTGSEIKQDIAMQPSTMTSGSA
ncbi:hypothetical protein HHK36_000778 [Tetracentron sinense]|uniref:Uncharacterized protein n=1 Tax=Tetracentron sinense TaxID=13715 RepID=A0A834ZWZ5_TETSI|nr:hypothetical protein HHK36_000778 [Tetracentron sinense]